MPTHPSSFLCRALRLILLASLLPALAGAHGVFDHSSRVWFFEDHLEAVVTLGPEAAKPFLNDGPDGVLRSGQMAVAYPFPLQNAPRLFEIKSGGTVIEPLKANVRSDGLEYNFTLFYPRPPAGPLKARAVYMAGAAHLTKGALAACDENGTGFAAKMLSSSEDELEINPPSVLPIGGTASIAAPQQLETSAPAALPATVAEVLPPPAAAPGTAPSFREFLTLGIGHILTGFDHLLFLGALLMGVRKLRPMLAVITCFTLAHSITLALAASNLVTVSDRLVEPLIAISIIIVCVENFLRRDATQDRYWLAGGFGLIHGFGFASALRATGLGGTGAAIVMPLFAFNLGVEIGQLAVAAAVVPLLFLLRRRPAFTRFGTPAFSTVVMALAGYWFLERTVFHR